MTNNLNILPFYASVDKQHHRKAYSYDKVYPIIAPINSIPSSQIIIPRFESFNNIVATIYKVDGTDAYYNAQDSWIGIQAKRTNTYGVFIFNPGNTLSAEVKSEGQYYMRLDLNINLSAGGTGAYTYYSEVFTWVEDVSKYLKLEYWDNQNLPVFDNHIDYESGYKNTVYLQTQLGKPEYPFEEEIVKRDGYEFPEKQLSEKRFRFTFLAPEFLIDALRIVRMHDNVYITNIDSEVYRSNSFLLNLSRWEDQGDLAALEVEFECDTIIKKIGTGILNS